MGMPSLPVWLFIAAGVCFVIAVVCFRRAKQGMIWITLSVIFVLLAMSQLYSAQAQRKALEQGEYWLAHCQLRVANINNGVFQDKTNQLDCEGVITYVPTQDYVDALDAVKKQQQTQE